MFKELAPVLRHRAVLMTITSTEDDQIRVNIVPKKLKDDENKALTTPISVTGTAEELDAELGPTLVDFVASHLQLKNTLVQARADMETAAKVAQAEARSKSKTPIKRETDSTGTSKPTQQPTKAAEPVQRPAPKTASLFDMPVAEPPELAPASRASTSKTESSEEDDPLAEINEEADEGEDLDQVA
jgi:PRTRC genetic system protein E